VTDPQVSRLVKYRSRAVFLAAQSGSHQSSSWDKFAACIAGCLQKWIILRNIRSWSLWDWRERGTRGNVSWAPVVESSPSFSIWDPYNRDGEIFFILNATQTWEVVKKIIHVFIHFVTDYSFFFFFLGNKHLYWKNRAQMTETWRSRRSTKLRFPISKNLEPSRVMGKVEQSFLARWAKNSTKTWAKKLNLRFQIWNQLENEHTMMVKQGSIIIAELVTS